jgi:4-carboxymuconolactone decarboxylase
MTDYLPAIYVEFQQRFPDVTEAQGALARVIRERTPFDHRTDRLIKFVVAVGAESQGAVRSNVRKALDHGVTVEELRAADAVRGAMRRSRGVGG